MLTCGKRRNRYGKIIFILITKGINHNNCNNTCLCLSHIIYYIIHRHVPSLMTIVLYAVFIIAILRDTTINDVIIYFLSYIHMSY